MDTQRRATPTGRWVSADEWLKSTEDTPDVALRSIARPVYPVSDEECYALNPPRGCSSATRNAGLREPTGLRGRRRAISDAEQAARAVANRRVDQTSDSILRLARGEA